MITFLSKYRYFLLYLFICNLYVLPLSGQTITNDYLDVPIDQKKFDNQEWQSLQKSLDYTQKKKKKKKAEPEAEKREPFSFPDFPNFPDLSGVLKVFAILTLVSLLSLLVYQIIQKTESKLNSKNNFDANPQAVKGLVSVGNLAEQLDKHDINPYIDQAEQDRNYPLAVRLHFLALLKKMYEKDLIHWKKDHTNNTYLNQMRGKDTYSEFKKITKKYEHIWYGDKHPLFKEYEVIRKEFIALQADINKERNT